MRAVYTGPLMEGARGASTCPASVPGKGIRLLQCNAKPISSQVMGMNCFLKGQRSAHRHFAKAPFCEGRERKGKLTVTPMFAISGFDFVQILRRPAGSRAAEF